MKYSYKIMMISTIFLSNYLSVNLYVYKYIQTYRYMCIQMYIHTMSYIPFMSIYTICYKYIYTINALTQTVLHLFRFFFDYFESSVLRSLRGTYFKDFGDFPKSRFLIIKHIMTFNLSMDFLKNIALVTFSYIHHGFQRTL